MRSHYFEDDVDSEGHVVKVQHTSTSERKTTVVWEKPHPKSLKDIISEGMHYRDKDDLYEIYDDISNEEVEVFADLLSKLVRYDPEERISVTDVLEHEWFKRSFPVVEKEPNVS